MLAHSRKRYLPSGAPPPHPYLFSISSPDSRRSLAMYKVFLRPAKSSLGKQGSLLLFSMTNILLLPSFLSASLPSCSHPLWNQNNQREAYSLSGAGTGETSAYRSKWILRIKHDTKGSLNSGSLKKPCVKMTSTPQDRSVSCTHHVWSFQGKANNTGLSWMTDLKHLKGLELV